MAGSFRSKGGNMTDGSVGALNREQLDRLVSYFDEEVISA
jgi:hypothetical protein